MPGPRAVQFRNPRTGPPAGSLFRVCFQYFLGTLLEGFWTPLGVLWEALATFVCFCLGNEHFLKKLIANEYDCKY